MDFESGRSPGVPDRNGDTRATGGCSNGKALLHSSCRLCHAVNESGVELIALSNQLNGPYVDDGQRRRQRLPKRASWVTGQWILPSKGSTLGVKVFK